MGDRNGAPRDKDRKQCFDLLPIARGIQPASRFAAEILGLKPPMWAMITNGSTKFPPDRVDLLLQDFRRYFTTFTFEIEHLDLPVAEFVGLFAKEPVYSELRKAINDPSHPPPPPSHPLERFFGTFLGLYLCRDPDDRNKQAVAYDAFRIFGENGNLRLANIEQLTNAFSTQPARGRLRVQSDTVEIAINFGNAIDPDAIYMASYPKGDEVNTLLAISVDIKAGPRLVVARPALFVRAPEEGLYIPTIYGQRSPLYSAVKRVFQKCVQFNSKGFEMVPDAQLDEESEAFIRSTLMSLRREAKEVDRAGKKAGTKDVSGSRAQT